MATAPGYAPCGTSREELTLYNYIVNGKCVATYLDVNGVEQTCGCPYQAHLFQASEQERQLMQVKIEQERQLIQLREQEQQLMQVKIEQERQLIQLREQEKKKVEVRIIISDVCHILNVTLTKQQHPLETVKNAVLKTKLLGRKMNIDHFVLTDENFSFVGDFDSINTYLVFYLPSKIEPESASNWTGRYLAQLNIDFVDLTLHFSPIQTALPLLNRLQLLRPEDITTFTKLTGGETNPPLENMLHDPLIKAVFMIHKYPNNESVVDLFLILLLKELGYFDDRLFVFPQFRLKLRFGDVVKEAIPDLLVMDVLSYFRMALVEDKNQLNVTADSEPQLIAELIAVHQANSRHGCKRKYSLVLNDSTEGGVAPEINSDDAVLVAGGDIGISNDIDTPSTLNFVETVSPSVDENNLPSLREILESDESLIGIRLNGTRFHFYVIKVTDAILTALSSKMSTTQKTYVHKIGPLYFENQDDRAKIIHFLTFCRSIIHDKGHAEKREL